MSRSLDFNVTAQPDEVTCGPTCLHSVYRYFGDEVSLDAVIADVRMLDAGGTLDVFLANHALERGYRASLFSYNLQLFDPTWYRLPAADLAQRLQAQAKAKRDPKLRQATRGYLRFLELGGETAIRRPAAGADSSLSETGRAHHDGAEFHLSLSRHA